MSLMNTVTKMAIGFAVAKGMDAVNRKGGIGAVLGGLSAGGGSGLGGLLDQLGGSGAKGAGLGGMLAQLGGARGGASGLGGLGALLGGLANARGGASPQGIEDLINADNPAQAPDEEEVARLMLRAMTQAARADGDIDEAERQQLLEALKEGDPSDVEAVQKMLDAPVNAHAVAADTPRGLETQVYAMSLNAITPDNNAELQYLNNLAEGLGLSPEVVNRLHEGMGVPPLYR